MGSVWVDTFSAPLEVRCAPRRNRAPRGNRTGVGSKNAHLVANTALHRPWARRLHRHLVRCGLWLLAAGHLRHHRSAPATGAAHVDHRRAHDRFALLSVDGAGQPRHAPAPEGGAAVVRAHSLPATPPQLREGPDGSRRELADWEPRCSGSRTWSASFSWYGRSRPTPGGRAHRAESSRRGRAAPSTRAARADAASSSPTATTSAARGHARSHRALRLRR